MYPAVGTSIGTLKIRPEVPNTGSISSTLNTYQTLKGIRAVPMANFNSSFQANFYSASDMAKCKSLAEQIKASQEISPLIVVVDKEGPYILEGAHRLVALGMLQVESIPAMVIIDLDSVNPS